MSMLIEQATALLRGETDPVSNAANLAALLWQELPDINWVGFYFLRGETLHLGPFAGQPACTRIAVGAGVCGTAAATRAVQRVADVHQFAGHIACDTRSQSELVVPLLDGERLLGVLDIDSPRAARFGADDEALAVLLAGVYVRSLSQPAEEKPRPG